MADVRSLLKAKRQEARISHPYATYTPSDQLKCSICAVVVKHASAWEGHLGSKAHRTAVARVRQAELEAAAAAASLEDARETPPPQASSSSSTAKRKASISGQDLGAKKRRTASSEAESGFPADFFSDPTRQLPVPDDEDNEEGGEDAMAVDAPTKTPAAGISAVDEEYERFQRELLKIQADVLPAAEKHELYARATVAVEEELFTEQQKSGYEGWGGEGDGENEKPMTGGETAPETEEHKRQRDRELIMDRLLEEERLQEDADLRVASMKARVDALKKKRELRKAARGST